MATIQTRNQDLEKRLTQLRAQLYGKKPAVSQISMPANQLTSRPADTLKRYSTDLIHLRGDLLKIFILAGLAFAFQFSLYFAMVNRLIKLPF